MNINFDSNLKSADDMEFIKSIIGDLLLYKKLHFEGPEALRRDPINYTLGKIKDKENNDVYIHFVVDLRPSTGMFDEEDNKLIYTYQTPFPFEPFRNYIVGMKLIPSLRKDFVFYGDDSTSIVADDEPLDFEEIITKFSDFVYCRNRLFKRLKDLIELVEKEDCYYVG